MLVLRTSSRSSRFWVTDADNERMTVPRLRPVHESDTQRVHEWASQERACRYQPWGPNTVEQTAQFVAEAAQTWSELGDRRVWAATTSDDGVIGIGDTNRHNDSCHEIAYAVHVDYWGRGFGTEIARLLIAEAFADGRVERVQATCDPRNKASSRVLRRAGLSVEGTLRHTMYVRDGWRDSTMHSILRHEWVAARA